MIPLTSVTRRSSFEPSLDGDITFLIVLDADDLTVPRLAAFPDCEIDNGEARDRIGPPPAEACIEAETKEGRRAQNGAERCLG